MFLIRFGTSGVFPMSYVYSETDAMHDRKGERCAERGFGRQELLANSIENYISHEKKVTRRGPKIITKH